MKQLKNYVITTLVLSITLTLLYTFFKVLNNYSSSDSEFLELLRFLLIPLGITTFTFTIVVTVLSFKLKLNPDNVLFLIGIFFNIVFIIGAIIFLVKRKQEYQKDNKKIEKKD